METKTITEEKSGDYPHTTRVVDQLRGSKSVAARIRRQLNYSLLGLSGLAVILGILVAYGAYGFRLSYRLFDQWVHDAGHISPGLSQMLLLAVGSLCFGLILKALGWQHFRGPANVIIAVHEHNGRLKIKNGLITAGCDALALGLETSVGRYGPAVQLGVTVGAIPVFSNDHLGLTHSASLCVGKTCH